MTADRRRVPPGGGQPAGPPESRPSAPRRGRAGRRGADPVQPHERRLRRRFVRERKRGAPARPGAPPRRVAARHHGPAAQRLGGLPADQEGPRAGHDPRDRAATDSSNLAPWMSMSRACAESLRSRGSRSRESRPFGASGTASETNRNTFVTRPLCGRNTSARSWPGKGPKEND